MNDLIEALQIVQKYVDPSSVDCEYPTHPEHDNFVICAMKDWKKVSRKDKKRLKELSFDWGREYECLQSYRFGSC